MMTTGLGGVKNKTAVLIVILYAQKTTPPSISSGAREVP